MAVREVQGLHFPLCPHYAVVFVRGFQIRLTPTSAGLPEREQNQQNCLTWAEEPLHISLNKDLVVT